MTAMNTAAPELLRLRTVREMLQSPGPCLTILLPPYRPGEPAGSPGAVLKSLAREAASKLTGHLPKAEAAKLLEPLAHAAEDVQLNAGSHWGRAIFRSPSVFEQVYLTQPPKASLTLAGSFWIRPLAGELARPRAFYIITLSKARVAVLRCAGIHAEPVKLPHGVPETLEEALELEPPDHDLENRSAVRKLAGSPAGAMLSARFGTGSGRETKHAHLADFYKLIDHGLDELVREPETPVILAGVEEDTAMFRSVSSYRNLAGQSIPRSADGAWRNDELLAQAYGILRADATRRQAAALALAKERTAPARLSTDPDSVLHAAFEGRVGQLYVNESADRTGVFERRAYHSWGQEDLLNLAAVKTISQHGEAYALPAEAMPDGAAVVAIMRY